MTSDPVGPGAALLAEARALTDRKDWRALADRAGAPAEETLRAEPELGYLYANAMMRVGEVAGALALAGRVEPAVRASGDRRLLLRTINLVGALRFEMGDTAAAEERFGDLLDRAAEWADDEFAARASNNLGVLANVRGDREIALTFYQRALASYQRLGYLRGLAQTHYNLGVTYRELGFPREAEAHYARAIRFAERCGTEDVVGLAESDRGLLHVETGDPRMGEAFARRARARFERLGDPVRGAEAVRVLAAAARASGRTRDAASLLQDALATARAHENLLLHAEVQRDRGLLLRDLGDHGAAREALLHATSLFERIGASADVALTRELTVDLPA